MQDLSDSLERNKETRKTLPQPKSMILNQTFKFASNEVNQKTCEQKGMLKVNKGPPLLKMPGSSSDYVPVMSLNVLPYFCRPAVQLLFLLCDLYTQVHEPSNENYSLHPVIRLPDKYYSLRQARVKKCIKNMHFIHELTLNL